MDEKNKKTSLTKAVPLLKPADISTIVKREKSKDFAVDIFAPQFIVIDSIIGSLKIRYPMNKEKLDIVGKFLKAEKVELKNIFESSYAKAKAKAKKPDNTMNRLDHLPD